MKKILLFLLLLPLLIFPSCMTILSQSFDSDEEIIERFNGSRNYAGVKSCVPLLGVRNPIVIAPFDIILCAVADTLILPLTLWQTYSISKMLEQRQEDMQRDQKALLKKRSRSKDYFGG